ncbi:MAG: 4'-phosphopantetheinyl transferase superfamily protein [Methylococcaceae bacterium]|nr:MAG: 4'-phosphopantetheinyl transferase superfamily protein [Methylococcaceae bacterium]
MISIWRLPLPEGPDDAGLLTLLDAAERQRAARYLNAPARRRFLLCRAALRLLLARQLSLPPLMLQLHVNDYGKPYLAEPVADLAFNLTHSDELGLIAISRAGPVGVDVESWRDTRQMDAIAQRCFAAAEYQRWQDLAQSERTPAFFKLWTRKEAFAKAVGRGIALGLEHIEFGQRGELIAVPPDCGHVGDWWVCDLDVAEGYSAAVATAGADARVKIEDFVWDGRELGV